MKQQKFAQVKWLGFAHVKSLDFDQVKISHIHSSLLPHSDGAFTLVEKTTKKVEIYTVRTTMTKKVLLKTGGKSFVDMR